MASHLASTQWVARAGVAARRRAVWLLAPLAAALAWWAGSAAPVQGTHRSLAIGTAIVSAVIPILWTIVPTRVRTGFLTIELPLILLLVSTLVLRSRTASSLEYNPLDPAAQFRVLCVFAAAVLGLLAYSSAKVDSDRRLPLSLKVYCLYVIVVFLGAPLSFNLFLTAYRGVELAVGVLVVVGAWKLHGRRIIPRFETVLFWYVVALIGSAWLGLLLFPGEAALKFENTLVPIQFQLNGVEPLIPANGLGLLGVILALWAPLRTWSPWRERILSRRAAILLCLLGVATVLATQYRTGYIALTSGFLVLLFVKRRWLGVTLLVIAVGALLSWKPTLLTKSEPYVLRGQTVAQAEQLSGRLNFWAAAIPVWETSPLLGRGLLTASRFEVLAPLGFDSTSTIHSTWVEVLVGTGVVGTTLLFVSLAATVYLAFGAVRRSNWALPLVLLTALVVRSVTGSTIEVFDFPAVLFLWIGLAVADNAGLTQSDRRAEVARSLSL
jgi:O-antigen ligase